MSEVTEGKSKPQREVEVVTMSDGRKVEFVGKRKLLKETIIEGSMVSVRLDFRNGETRTFPLPAELLLKFAGHGAEQKLGDETAGTPEVDDMVLGVDALIEQLSGGVWSAGRAAGDGFAGASVVVKAIMQMYGKTKDEVKMFLDNKLAELNAGKEEGAKVSRAKLYASFRNPASKIGQLIQKLESEARVGKSVLDADEALSALG